MSEGLVLVEAAQGSAEWHALRRVKRPASITPMVMGTSKWGDAADAYDSMMGDTVEDDVFIGILRDYGNRTEPRARAAAEKLLGIRGFPVVGYRDDYLASLDFFGTKDGKRIGVEVKCPYQKAKSATWKSAQKQVIEPGYSDQITHQRKVFELDEAYLFVYIDDATHALLKHEEDPDRWQQITKEWDRFVRDHLSTFERPNPYNKRTDLEWAAAADRFIRMQSARKAAEEQEEKFKAELLKLAGGKKCEGAGVRVNIFQTRGNVDYKSIVVQYEDVIKIAAPDYTAESFRKAPRTTEAVTVIKAGVDAAA